MPQRHFYGLDDQAFCCFLDSFVVVFIVNILVYYADEDTHQEHLMLVL